MKDVNNNNYFNFNIKIMKKALSGNTIKIPKKLSKEEIRKFIISNSER